MMQFTENAPPSALHPTRTWPDFAASAKSLGSFNNAACMEQLLAHCAHAIEANDATLAQQLLWVLHNIAPPDGDSNQRLTSAFLRALLLRASRAGSSISGPAAPLHPQLPLRLSAISLAGFIDLTPWHRFGFSAANSAIAGAADGFPVLHLVDLTTTHCMQIPTLIDALASRPEGPPFLRLTIPSTGAAPSTCPPPTLDISVDELGCRLVNFARSRNVGMDFRVVPSTAADGFHSLIEYLGANSNSAGEALVINCHMMPHRIPDESAGGVPSPRAAFAKALRSLEPSLVVLVGEEADFTASDVVTRLRAAFNYMWIPFDAVETFLPPASEQRRRYEAAVCWKIENVIAQEGVQRVERLEPRGRWGQRMRAAGFAGVGFGEEAAAEVKGMLDEHSAGWGMKRDEDDLVLTWKGHDVVFATAWIPSSAAS